MALSSSLAIIIISFFLSINVSVNLVSAEYLKVATIFPYSIQIWQGECFQKNNGYVTYTQDFGLGYIIVQTSESQSLFCSDSYEFRVLERTIAADTFYTSIFTHEVAFAADNELLASIRQNGVSAYLDFQNGLESCSQKNESDIVKELKATLEAF